MSRVHFEIPDKWAESANEMDMPASEYVRRMTRAGRRQFGYDQSGRSSEVEHTLKTNKEESNTADIKGFVEKNLATKTAIDEDELVDLIRDDIGSAIDELRDDGKAKYSASEGGWLRVVNDE